MQLRRETLGEFVKLRWIFLTPGLIILSAGIGLLFAGDPSGGFFTLFIYLPIIVLGAIALTVPVLRNWKEVPLIALLIATVLFAVSVLFAVYVLFPLSLIASMFL